MPDYTHAPEPLGVPTRRAALRLLDAVLRRGESLESALPAATRAIHGPDRGLAHAIAAETLRRLPDLDAMIDSVTKTNLPDDAKARMALRIALVQVLILGTPSHAAISTVLPLVDGGPRKLVHGVFGTLFRANMLLPEVPTLPAPVELRWEAAWGEEMVDDAGRAIAAPPPLDLTIADPAETEGWREKLGGESFMPGHLRLGDHASVPDMEALATAPGGCRTSPPHCPRACWARGRAMSSICARHPAARRCSSPPRAGPSPRSTIRRAGSSVCERISIARI